MTTANLTVIESVLFKRGNSTVAGAYTGVPGEIIIDTTLQTIRVQDGATAGGTRLATHTELGTQSTLANANAVTQTTEINSLRANITAANAAITSLQSNAAIQATLLDTLTGNAVTQSQVLDTLTSNAATQANTLSTLLGNAVAQQTSLIDLLANAATQAQAIASVTGTYSNANVATYLSSFDGNILPAANVTYSLGSEQFQWKDLWVSNNTIYIGNTPVRVDSGTLLVNGAPVGGSYNNANVAAYLPTYTGNIAGNIVKSGYTWRFGEDGTTTFPTNISINYSGGNVQFPRIIADTGKAFSVQAQGNIGSAALSWTVNPDSAGQYAAVAVTKGGGDNLAKVVLTAQADSGDAATAKTWQFNQTGTTRFPGDAILAPAGTSITMQSDQYSQLMWENANVTVAPNMAINSNFYVAQNNATLDIVYRDGSSNQQQKSWLWGVDGSLTLPAGGTITEGGGISGAIRLTPAGGANANQALLIYPTGNAEGDHVHMTAGGGSTELYLGNDFHYVKLVDGGNIELRAATANLSSQAAWTFDTTGNVDTIQALGIKVPDGVPTNVAVINSTTGSWELNPNLSLATTGGSGTGLTVNVAETGGYASTIEIATAGTGYNNGDLITVTSGTSNATFTIVIGGRNTWQFGTDGRLTFPGTPRIDTDSNNFEVQAAESINFEANAVVNIYTDSSGNAYQWQFGDDGSLTFPTGGNLVFDSSAVSVIDGVTDISAIGTVGANVVQVLSDLTSFGASPAPRIYGFSSIATTGSAVNEGNISASGNLVASQNAYVTGNVLAAQYNYANGVSISTSIQNGISNVRILSSGGLVSINVGSASNIALFTTTGASIGGTLSTSGFTATGAVTLATASGNINLGISQTTGHVNVGGTAQTGTILIGQSTYPQTINIGHGVTGSGNTKTIQIGENGAAGSTTLIDIGPDTASAAGTVTFNTATVVNIANTGGNALSVAGNITAGNINAGQFNFANGVNIFDTITGVTSINSSVSTLTVSDASGDYTYGALSYDYAVNGSSNSFSIQYSAPLAFGNVDINVGNVTATGTANVANLTTTGNITAGNINAGQFNFANGVNILSTVGAGAYGNANVASYLLNFDGDIEFTSSTAKIGNVDVITVMDHIRSPAYRFSNGTSIFDGITGTYSNTNVASYLTTGNTITVAGQVRIDSTDITVSPGNGALVVAGGVGIGGNLHVQGNITQRSAYYETYANVTNSGGNLTCNFVNGATFYATLTANVTVNFANVAPTGTPGNTVTGATIIIDQGATAYCVANVQVNGVNQTVRWVGAAAGVGTANNTDVMSFSLIALSTNPAGPYRVLGQISNYG